MTTPEPIRVLIADDHQLVREGIVRIVSRHPDISIVAEASNGRQAVELYRIHEPDVCLIDLRMPELSGMETITEILSIAPNAKLIILSAYDGEDDVYQALQLGAMSYVVKDVIEQDLINTIRSIAEGQKQINREIASKLLERLSKPNLTERELDVITLLVRGRSNREIAIQLGITEGTVKVHLNNLYTKLGVRDRAGATSVAIQRGIVHID
jgi:two-component system, NarL family, response regulator